VKRRFVVQRHDVKPGERHFDFMVERGEKLATWKLAAPLPEEGSVQGERSFDHRALYLDYEGEIAGGRGRVEIVLRGSLEDRDGDPDSPRWVFSIGAHVFSLEARGEEVTVRRIDDR